MHRSPDTVVAVFIAGTLSILAIAIGIMAGMALATTEARAQTALSSCYTIQDHLLVVDNVAKQHKVGTKVFIWTHPKDGMFKAFYVFYKNSPGMVGLSIYYDGCLHPLPNGQAYEAIKINSSILKNLATAVVVYDSGEVGLKEADEHVDPTLHDETW